MEGARYLEDGKLTVFKRAGIFYARIRVSAVKYIWRSLKTTDEQTAIRLGRRLLFQIEQRTEQGLPPKSKLFAAVIDDDVRHRQRDHAQGLQGKQSLPTVTFTPKKKRVRPAFEIPEYRRLWRTMYKRINDAKDRRTRRSRELLRGYVLVLANCGMRIGEANNLRIRD